MVLKLMHMVGFMCFCENIESVFCMEELFGEANQCIISY